MKKKYLILAALVLAGAGFAVWRSRQGSHEVAVSTVQYYCPMHPTYTSDKPGDCPICNMSLIPMEEEKTATLKNICILHKCNMADCPMEFPVKEGQKMSCPVCGTHVAKKENGESGKPLYYRHPMKPEITSSEPKKDEMGMDYVPVYAEEATETSVEGQAAVTITPEHRQRIGMKSEAVIQRPLSSTVRASGRVAYDPDLYNAISEYREAVKAREKVKDSPLPDIQERSAALVRASRLRLRQMGLSDAQIEEFGRAEEQSENLLLGEAGGTVWVYAQVYEYEIGLIRPGQIAEIATPAYPGRKFRGAVKAVDPILSAETRSLKVRIEVPNPEGRLKLEMYVNASIYVDMGRRLALPESALFDTGERQLVFVDLGEGRIEPREVRLGREADGYYEILSGVREGEKVVTSANFLIDSESKLKSAISGQSRHSREGGNPEKKEAAPPEHRH